VTARSDKDRFFKEPGFIFGVTIARPKVYIKAQRAFAASMLQGALDWMPAVLKERVELGLKKFVGGHGPLGGTGFRDTADTDDYIVDLHDLFVHGDQFVNYALTATDANILVGQHIGAQTNAEASYPATASVNALFVGSTDATRLVRQDGVVNLKVLGTQIDPT